MKILSFASRFLLALLAICPLFASANETRDEKRALQLISSLENSDSRYLFDMHGNANRDLQAIMKLRFGATKAATVAIDRIEPERSKAEYVAALYRALGFVKDPASIDWLKQKVISNKAPTIYDFWLPEWLGSFYGFGTWPWLQGRSQWIEFFVDTFKREANSLRRADLLKVLSGFDDEAVVSFFHTQTKLVLDPRETLMVERYLAIHGVKPDDVKIQRAIAALSKEPDNRQFLVDFSYAFSHEAFIPFLISAFDFQSKEHSQEASWNPQGALEYITFEFDVQGKGAWLRWAAEHAGENRLVWRDRAIESLRIAMRHDQKSALLLFEKCVYRWGDMMFFEFIEAEIATRAAFRSSVAGWINLTYQPAYRPKLASLAKKITTNPKSLQPWARDLLIGLKLLPGLRKRTWADEVRFQNMRV